MEGLLARVAASRYRDDFVLKGGVLLAAFSLRRPTRDIDLQATGIANDPTTVLTRVTDIAAIDTDDGLTFVECNPRATDGLLLMPREELAAGLLAPRRGTFVLKPGGQVQLSLAVLADGFADQLDRLPQSIDDLAQVRDAGSGWHDPLPTLYSALAICHSVGQSLREHMVTWSPSPAT